MATAAQLVKQVRDAIQHFGQTPYHDGFADDVLPTSADTAANTTSILDWINKAIEELLETEYAMQTVELDLTPGTAEYALDPNVHELRRVSLYGTALDGTTLGKQDARYPGWANYPGLTFNAGATADAQPYVVTGQPQRYYTYGDRIGFDPCPDQAYPVTLLAEFIPPPLVVETDVPAHLPLRYHRYLASRAAWWISSFDVENPAAQARMPGLDADWQLGYRNLQRMIQERTDTEDDQIDAGGYRQYFRRGGY